MEGALIPKEIVHRPLVMPFAIDWCETIYKEYNIQIQLQYGSTKVPIWMADLELNDPGLDNALSFKISLNENEFHYHLILDGDLDNPSYKVFRDSHEELFIQYGTRSKLLEDFFTDSAPLIFFVDGSMLEGNEYTRIEPRMIFQKEELTAWNWEGTNIRSESQGLEKDVNSVQWKMIDWIKTSGEYSVVIDDDDKGEIADVVCLKIIEEEKTLLVHLFHCKYSMADNAGARVDDLYQVCGQAQKSIKWMDNTDALFSSLLKRNAERTEKTGISRIEFGTQEEIEILRRRARKDLRVRMQITIVQPGLSFNRTKENGDVLHLLGVVKSYLYETWEVPLIVICNE